MSLDIRGRAPLGYLNFTPNIKGGQNSPIITEDPERFERVKKLFQLMLTGNYTVPKLLDVMNRELGLRVPETRKYPSRPMTLSGLYKMLTNPFYYGWFQWQGEWTEGKHKPMITAEEYDKIQYLLGRKGQPRQRVHKFAFTGMIRCGGCGAMVTAEEKFKTLKSGKVLHFVYYHCTKKSLPKCMEKSIEVKKLHQQIDSMLAGLTISDRFQAWAVQHLHEIRTTEARTREESLAAKQRMFAKVTQDIDNLVTRFTASSNAKEEILTTEEYQKLKGRLLKEKSILEEDLKQHGVELEDWVELSERTFDFARYARIWFERGDLDAKRAIFACLGSNPLIKDQRLMLNLQKPLQLIFENKDLCEKEFDRLEPAESPEKLPVVEDFAKQFPLMSG
jgi:site-specific DNA recombinase